MWHGVAPLCALSHSHAVWGVSMYTVVRTSYVMQYSTHRVLLIRAPGSHFSAVLCCVVLMLRSEAVPMHV
jgi:hypothetical protein